MAAVLRAAEVRVAVLCCALLLAEERLAVLRSAVLRVVVVRFAAAEVRADAAPLFAVLRAAAGCVVRLAVVTFFFIYDGS